MKTYQEYRRLRKNDIEVQEASKKNRYVRPGIDDMLSVNVTEMPVDYLEAQAYVREELGL